MTIETNTYVAFLRGINVGGHHKLPMADLKALFTQLGFLDVITILNSGNVIFNASSQDAKSIEENISIALKNKFGFPVPTSVRKAIQIQDVYQNNPFKGIEITKEIRLYISFLREDVITDLRLPWISGDKAYQIIEKRDSIIFSVLDLSISKTTTAMKILENTYGKDMTTRNWKTIERIIKKL